METGTDFCMMMTRFYVWKGQSRRDAEYLLLAKTRSAFWPALEDFMQAHHPYALPELLQLPVMDGSADYLQWLLEATQPRRPPPAPPQE